MHWTKEPEEPPNYSDWRVSLVRLGSGDDENHGTTPAEKRVVTYHKIHRVLLGDRSHYFERLFTTSSDFSESKDCHSQIVLPQTLSDEAFQWTKDAFEIFLDQCYQKEPVATTCISLQILVGEVEDWIWNVMNEADREEGPGDLYHAVKEFRAAGFNLEKAQPMIAKFCVGKDPEADLPLWLEISSLLSDGTAKRVNGDWSTNIAYFLKDNVVSYQVFQQLTGKSVLTYIDPNAACSLLQLDHDLKASPVVNSGDTEAFENEPTTEFRELCIDALKFGHPGDFKISTTSVLIFEPNLEYHPLNGQSKANLSRRNAEWSRDNEKVSDEKNRLSRKNEELSNRCN
eukprot:jgi/Psemu1/9846/gm1.9846_g